MEKSDRISLPIYEEASSLRADGSRNYVHPADVRGRFHRLRQWIFALLIVVYVSLPWIRIGGRPAVFLHLVERKFYLFGAVFNAQDVWLMFFLLSGVAFALVLVTTLYGRVWCGYACPHTVFLEGVYRRIERWIEGPRAERLRRNQGGWTLERLRLKLAKHAIFVALSVLLAHVFLSYFVSLPGLFDMVRHSPRQHPEAFLWVLGISAAVYFNFGWFREQLCLIICPYGRLQSALLDSDSLVIGYDKKRGEPRGKLGEAGAGDCVQCNRCVAVCPTGIDIRNGLQVDCIGCSACVDACDEVMTKVGKAPGLVRYDSLKGLEGLPKRFWRPRLGLYAGLGLAGLGAAGIALARYETFEANLLRASSVPFIVSDGEVRNLLTLHLVNKRRSATTYEVRGKCTESGRTTYVIPRSRLRLEPLEGIKLPVLVSASKTNLRRGMEVCLDVGIVGGDQGLTRRLKTPFLTPDVERSPQ